MEKAILARHELYESTECLDVLDRTSVDLAFFWDSHDSLDLVEGSIDRCLVGRSDDNVTLAVDFVDCNLCACLFLNALDCLTTLSDDSTDEVLVNIDSHKSWCVLLKVFTSLWLCLKHALENMMTTFLGLLECLLENLV